MAVEHLKSGKAGGEDGITAEQIKYGGPILMEKLLNLISEIWKHEKIPEAWKTALIVPIHKKGDTSKCENYRGIALLDNLYKILSYIILNRIKPYISENIKDHQAGFIQGRSTCDQIFILQQIVSKYWEFGKDLHLLFVDFEKAYDTVRRNYLWSVLIEFGIPQKLIRLIKECMENSKCKIKIGTFISDSFEVQSGVRQGDGLSPILFNFVLEKALQKLRNENIGISLGNYKINLLAYADDIVILGQTEDDIRKLFKLLEDETRITGLKINSDKTKYMQISRNPNNIGSLKIDDWEFQKVDEFKYLGSIINEFGLFGKEIEHRLITANKCYYSLHKLLSSKLLSRSSKLRCYKTIIMPTLLYCCETWVLTKKTTKSLFTFENKILRKIFGPIQENNSWRILKNKELREIYKDPDIIALIKSRRLRWLGHVLRRDDNSLLRKAFDYSPRSKRPLGRPRLRWEDQVHDNLRTVGGQQEDAENRDAWRFIVNEAKNQLGFVVP